NPQTTISEVARRLASTSRATPITCRPHFVVSRTADADGRQVGFRDHARVPTNCRTPNVVSVLAAVRRVPQHRRWLPLVAGMVTRVRLGAAVWVGGRHGSQRPGAYDRRRTTEGKTKKETIRCLERHVARGSYYTLRAGPTPLRSSAGVPIVPAAST